jgi:hypothetical protein
VHLPDDGLEGGDDVADALGDEVRVAFADEVRQVFPVSDGGREREVV